MDVAWSQLRFRTVRLVALLAGILLATTAFTVLTAASRTAQLRTVGTVTAHFTPAYDILVRPKGSKTALETRTNTVQPNFLSGIYGGITMAQYRQIADIPGVQVAAPIAMVGYTLLVPQLSFPLPAADLSQPPGNSTGSPPRGSPRAARATGLIRRRPTSTSLRNGWARMLGASTPTCPLSGFPDGKTVTICPTDINLEPGVNPFGVAAQSVCTAW